MKRFLGLLMFLTIGAAAGAAEQVMDIKLGQNVQIADGKILSMEPRVVDGTYATVTGAQLIDADTVEVTFKVAYTGPDKREILRLNPKTTTEFKVYVSPASSLSDIRGIEVLK